MDDNVGTVLILMLCCLVAGFFIGLSVEENRSEKRAVENSHAIYNSTSGDFEWLPPCREETPNAATDD